MEPVEATEKEKQIQREMEATRAALTDKLETLEQKVVGTVEDVTSATSQTVESIKETVATVQETVKDTMSSVNETVKGTVETVNETVKGTVETVNETVKGTVETVNETVKGSVEAVKDWVDIPGHVQAHPWLALGCSVATGYCLGAFLAPRLGSAAARMPSWNYYTGMPSSNTGAMHTESYPQPQPYSPQPASYSPPQPQPREEQPAESPSSIFAGINLTEWMPELSKLKSLALGVLFGTAREAILNAVPEYVGEQLKDVIDNATKKMGGEPIPAADIENMEQAFESERPERADESFAGSEQHQPSEKKRSSRSGQR